MTALELMQAAAVEHVFDATPMPEDLAALHVPFDSLRESRDTEATLEQAVRAHGRVALVGGMGVGKSSVSAFVLGPHAERFAPIQVVVSADDEVVRESGAFARYAVKAISAHAQRMDQLDDDERLELLKAVSDRRVLPSKAKSLNAELALNLWLARPSIARNVTKEMERFELGSASGAEHIEALERLVRTIEIHELVPVLVFDDSDRWLRHSDDGTHPKSELVEAFFGNVVRMVAELPIGIVVAVHQSYLDVPAYREATRGVLETVMEIPGLDDARQLMAILDHRLALIAPDATVDLLFEEPAIDALWDLQQQQGGRLRGTLAATHNAVQQAAIAGRATVSRALVEGAEAAIDR